MSTQVERPKRRNPRFGMHLTTAAYESEPHPNETEYDELVSQMILWLSLGLRGPGAELASQLRS